MPAMMSAVDNVSTSQAAGPATNAGQFANDRPCTISTAGRQPGQLLYDYTLYCCGLYTLAYTASYTATCYTGMTD